MMTYLKIYKLKIISIIILIFLEIILIFFFLEKE